MSIAEDRLEATEAQIAAMAEELEETAGIDRRHFMFYSLVAAAASTFGVEAARALGAPMLSSDASVPTPELPLSLFQPPVATPFPLGNGEAPALQFQAYPGGTGAFSKSSPRNAVEPRSIAPCSSLRSTPALFPRRMKTSRSCRHIASRR